MERNEVEASHRSSAARHFRDFPVACEMLRLHYIPFGHSPFTTFRSAQHDEDVVCGWDS